MGTITVNFDIIGYLPMKMKKNGNQPHRGVSQWFDFSGFNGCGTRYPLYWLYCRDIPVWRLNLGVAYHVNENMYMCADVKPKCRWHLHGYIYVCKWTCMCICFCRCIRIHELTNIILCTHIVIRKQKYVHSWTCVCISICICICECNWNMYKHECINIHIHMYKKVYAHASVCMHTSACASVYVQHGWMDGWVDGRILYIWK